MEGAIPASPRCVTCERCGAAFECSLDRNCWCVAEAVRLPLAAAGDCLCPACLKKAAAPAIERI